MEILGDRKVSIGVFPPFPFSFSGMWVLGEGELENVRCKENTYTTTQMQRYLSNLALYKELGHKVLIILLDKCISKLVF